MSLRTSFASVLVVLALAAGALGADHRVEALAEAAPADALSPEVAAALAPQGLRVIRGEKRTLCDVWLCAEWPVAGDFKASQTVLYPFTPGQLIGVVRFASKSSDFRDQDIAKGVYTLRYGQQPVDGNHVGTSPTRDFLLLVPADKDTSPAVIDDFKKLGKLSAEGGGGTHPVLMPLQKLGGELKDVPALRHVDEHDWWIVGFRGQAKAGGKKQPLPVEWLVVGKAAE